MACCAPSRDSSGETTTAGASRAGSTDGMSLIPAGTYRTASEDHFAYRADGEPHARDRALPVLRGQLR